MLHIESKSLDRYLKTIANIPVLSIAEETAVAKHLPQQWAKEKLIYHNLKFVVSEAKKYQGSGLSLMDLISEGNIGLITAANRFDVTRGFKFISYAVWWINQAIKYSLDTKSRLIRVPMNKISDQNQLKKFIELMCSQEHREPNATEIMSALGLTYFEYVNLLESVQKINYFEEPILDSDKRTFIDCFDSGSLTPEQELIESTRKKEILNLIDEVLGAGSIESDVVKLYFGLTTKYNESLSLQMIGEKYNLTRERIRQIKNSALKKLKRSKKFIDYL